MLLFWGDEDKSTADLKCLSFVVGSNPCCVLLATETPAGKEESAAGL